MYTNKCQLIFYCKHRENRESAPIFPAHGSVTKMASAKNRRAALRFIVGGIPTTCMCVPGGVARQKSVHGDQPFVCPCNASSFSESSDVMTRLRQKLAACVRAA